MTDGMKALSIRQPWAWLILNAGKDIENRVWSTRFRGRVLVHAAKGMTWGEYNTTMCKLRRLGGKMIEIPNFDELERGGIVGSVEIVDCVQHSDSPWFCGPWGFVLRNPEPSGFVPMRGQLGFFNPG